MDANTNEEWCVCASADVRGGAAGTDGRWLTGSMQLHKHAVEHQELAALRHQVLPIQKVVGKGVAQGWVVAHLPGTTAASKAAGANTTCTCACLSHFHMEWATTRLSYGTDEKNLLKPFPMSVMKNLSAGTMGARVLALKSPSPQLAWPQCYAIASSYADAAVHM